MSHIPLRIQAETLLRDLIDQEAYRNGKTFHNKVDLAKQFDISCTTLKQAN